ncbi:hypothetical protein QFZ62_001493 [Clavibacter sp. B3I6]|uniref:hypothetical protein n=1 Tax=Clavibacter sp. B3I6 TaxID=3042268 RepID=UPI0027810CCB|nr:hypothetical protein [Clavibacter sp. B3I6]MDQ0744185.1 hypothetical protein [Clavibacter sp. B3I6]
MDGFEIEAGGERFHVTERRDLHGSTVLDLTWLGAPGGRVLGVTIGGAVLMREQLIREAAAYVASHRAGPAPD